jgi:ParB-like chromosome segregation protein Spo0J
MAASKRALPSSSLVLLQGRVENRPLSALKPPAPAVRKHSKSQITKIAASIQEFGFIVPVLIDASDTVLAGVARLEAAARLQMEVVPTLRVDHLTEAQRRAFVIADNHLTELGSWDEVILKQELQALVDLDFNVQVIGYDTPELDKLLRVIDIDEEAPEVDEQAPVVAQLGDLFQLGRHRVYCGDSTLAASYEAGGRHTPGQQAGAADFSHAG